jgi:outer membrane lipopolysaccharide assembly protein LptE/RlpB
MKYLFFLFLFGCSVSAQKTSEEVAEEREFQQLMLKVEQTNDKSVQVQKAASKKEAELVTKAVATIIAMKGEIKDLKTELYEVKTRLDSVSIDTGNKFMLLPISNN